jgi:tRNA (guanosine-2'-O-)-methyltransferase
MNDRTKSKPSVRKRAEEIKAFRCKNLIAVIENPTDIKNIGTVIRNVNALGVEKVYVVDPHRHLPDDWQHLREQKGISKTSVSAVKWTFVKRFDSTDDCFDHLEKNNFKSIVTSPHVKGKTCIFLHEGDFTIHHKLAVWFGSEAVGISERAVERSEMCVSIPMFGMIESLNLGTSSGIVLYEVASSGASTKAGLGCGSIAASAQRRYRQLSIQKRNVVNGWKADTSKGVSDPAARQHRVP